VKKLFIFFNLFLIAFLEIFFLVSKSVLADGLIIHHNLYLGLWDYSDENNQQAFIRYENGFQKMIISVGLEDKDKSSFVWIFPVSSPANKVAIDIVKNLPQLEGEKISRKANLNLKDIRMFLAATQIYPIINRYFLKKPLIISLLAQEI